MVIKKLAITPITGGYRATFFAMGSPCEVQIKSHLSPDTQHQLLGDCYQEALRIEQKYSRYSADNLVARINRGERVQVDVETQRLIDYAEHCYHASAKSFDITSGMLRKFWRFDAKPMAQLPDRAAIAAALNFVGWDKVCWQAPFFELPPNMEIDFGGIGKEYAVDKVTFFLKSHNIEQCLVNFGGDLSVYSASESGEPWWVGIEQPLHHQQAAQSLSLYNGALATSGSTHRFCKIDGQIYGHILNPRTGFPVKQAPLSVTTFAESCTQAGMLATFAMLAGEDAENFLMQQSVQSWVIRP